MAGLVTIFGGSGFIGTQVVRAFSKRGWRIRAAVREPHLASGLRPLGDVGQIDLRRTNVTDRASVEEALDGADAAVNLVGLLYGGATKFNAVHVGGARNVAEAAARRGIARFVQMSAIGADPRSKSDYARTKGEAEAIVLKTIPTATILRPSIVFGPEDGFFNRFATLSTYTPALPLIGGGKTRFQPAYVGDVAEAVGRAIDDVSAFGGKVFELGGPGVYTFEDLLRLMLRETGRERALVPLPWPVASLVGLAGNVQSALMPPVLTTDQVLLLRRDNVVSPGAAGFAALGIEPHAVEAILPTYLWRYRRGGQFAQAPV